ncbi:hypothetical protein AALO_G00217870 [Alosa alosa]|uniref:AIG1-type G domain-containing protein n=1 Tax=Alosa alosa TaxID=278164 RepID=A0AAV6G257_9TELE|nr:GTPase IMAP family member 4 [Alosa alosa]KAG5268915.1 hypothetical protein AALO_G00217870 [Alosa alosa]
MDSIENVSTGDGVPNSGEDKQSTLAVGDEKHLSELRLVLLGWRWPGKSLTGNTILGHEEFRLERAAEFCVKREANVCGRQVIVVDTPGWFSTQTTPAVYQQEMVRGITMCPPGPHAFLLVIPVGMFTEVDRTCIEENLALLGDHVWRHTLVVFTWAEVLRDKPIERYIRREGPDLQWVVDKCNKRYHVINNYIFGEHPQLPGLIKKIENMVAEEGGHYKPDTEEKMQQNQHQSKNENDYQNQSSSKDLGARPKRNCSFGSHRSMDVETAQSISSQPND